MAFWRKDKTKSEEARPIDIRRERMPHKRPDVDVAFDVMRKLSANIRELDHRVYLLERRLKSDAARGPRNRSQLRDDGREALVDIEGAILRGR